ncbi:ABC transporter ATP-binding protein [Streptomyces sp. NPDC048255]|uniref:ABC transporter ATP-binding protein n=1 Tax=Streptomyces sp. NPDC048255 TaxID=3154713 RepID=UPI0033C75E64
MDVLAPPGEIVAFTGGNGSGKSTLLRIAVGLTRPTSGSVAGRPAAVGYVPDRFSPNEGMSAVAYLTHMGRVRGLATPAAGRRAHMLLDRLSLVGGRAAPLRSLSKGNAQKVALAQALMIDPGLLVLDEPWSGLDADTHGVLAEIMAEVAGAGGAVLFTDHRESVTRAAATRTYAVERGQVRPVAEEGEPATALRSLADLVLAAPARGPEPGVLAWEALDGVLSVRHERTGVALRVDRGRVDSVLLTALQHGWSVVRVAEASVSGHRTHTAWDMR